MERLKIAPRRQKEFRTRDGRAVSRKTGATTTKYGKSEADVEVAFAEEGDLPVLGVTALESLGYQVDPTTKKLKRGGC